MANAVGSDARQQRIHDLEVMTKFNQRAMQYAKGTLVQFNLKNNSDLNGKVGIIIDQNGVGGRLRVQVHGTTTNQVLQVVISRTSGYSDGHPHPLLVLIYQMLHLPKVQQ